MALKEGEMTFTRARLEALMNSHRSIPINGMVPFPWKVNGPSDLATRAYLESSARFQPDFNPKRHVFPSSEETFKMYSSLIDKYISLLPDLDRLDECFFEDLIEFNLQSNIPDRAVLDDTVSLLQRLPKMPIEFHDCEIDPSYHGIDEIHFSDTTTRSWETLKAASFVSTAVLSLALTSRSRDEKGNAVPIGYIATDLCRDITRLTDEVVRRSKKSSRIPVELFILKTYLWNALQRTIMLRYNSVLGDIIVNGFGGHDYHYQGKESQYKFLETAFERAVLLRDPNRGNRGREIGYICQWAYGLFKSNPNALTMDYRHLTHRFGEVFGTKAPRCNRRDNGAFEVCDGSSPLSCQRFFGMKIEDQSAHATHCNGNCRRLYWDEASYRRVDGGRAVSVVHTTQNLLQYCSASSTTIAISHVWSHGQGGRPEKGGTGLNQCLHERYSKIAHANAADSYWIDTACIPGDHKLRDEAIRSINSTFEASRFTLVCDRDLAEVDVSVSSIESLERLLAVFLLCDWNVRAWTLLEGMRGRKNIYILCKNEQVLSLHNIVAQLQRKGRLDLSILALVTQQLLPANRYFGNVWNKAKHTKEWHDPRWTISGIMDPFQAATLLSHRHASRQEDERSDGDIIVIWSLLCSKSTHNRAADLWSKTIMADGRNIPTGFLISSLPRLSGVKNLSWAPSRPDLPQNAIGNRGKKRFPAFLSIGSHAGYIVEGVFLAVWLRAIVKIPALAKLHHINASTAPIKDTLAKRYLTNIIAKYLRDYKWVALLRPARDNGVVSCLRTRNEDLNVTPFVPFEYEGDSDGVLLALIGSNDKLDSKPEKLNRQWVWLDIIEWDKDIRLPEFIPALVHLV